VVGNGNTTYYSSFDATGNWEVGIGTYSTTGPTLTRTTIRASSNSGSAVTFSGTCNVFVTYPSEKSVNLDASGNVSALGTVSSGTWNGATIPVAYGGTGVTASSGANSVVLRDASANVAFNNFTAGAAITTAAAGTTTLTVASARTQILVGSTTQTYVLPDATTLALGQSFIFVNNSSGLLTVQDYATAVVEVIPSGGITQLGAVSIATVAGTWGPYSFIPAAINWGTNSLNLASTVITGGTWQGGTIQSGYGGTGLTTFTGANNALYSTSSSALAAGTLPIAAGGIGATTLAGASIATYTGIETLTNKRIDPRVTSAASASSLTPSVATADIYAYTALAAGLTINAPTGTPVDGDKLIFRFLDNGSAQTLTWNATYTVIGVTLPTTTTASKTTYVGCIYNANNTRWDVIASLTQA
jgi:hypothetical protein